MPAASIAGRPRRTAGRRAEAERGTAGSAARSGRRPGGRTAAGSGVDQGAARLRVQRGAGGASAGRPVSRVFSKLSHDGGSGLSRRSGIRGGPARETRMGPPHRNARLSARFLPPWSLPPAPRLWPRLLLHDLLCERSSPASAPPVCWPARARPKIGAQNAADAAVTHGSSLVPFLAVRGRASRDSVQGAEAGFRVRVPIGCHLIEGNPVSDVRSGRPAARAGSDTARGPRTPRTVSVARRRARAPRRRGPPAAIAWPTVVPTTPSTASAAPVAAIVSGGGGGLEQYENERQRRPPQQRAQGRRDGPVVGLRDHASIATRPGRRSLGLGTTAR